jgi:hypothetical protein
METKQIHNKLPIIELSTKRIITVITNRTTSIKMFHPIAASCLENMTKGT